MSLMIYILKLILVNKVIPFLDYNVDLNTFPFSPLSADVEYRPTINYLVTFIQLKHVCLS